VPGGGRYRGPVLEEFDFEGAVLDALDGLPAELRAAMSNVSILVEAEPPPGEHLFGLYTGVPLTERTSSYGAVLPDTITIFAGPLGRAFGRDAERLKAEITRTVRHEIAHHFGISDDRLVELDRY
jgi:predicted Zn-dependent protease with MMP-like domain